MFGRVRRYRAHGAGDLSRVVATALGAATLATGVAATTASAVVTTLHGHDYGVTPINGVDAESLPRAAGGSAPSSLSRAGPRPYDEPPDGGTKLEYHGGPVMHSNATHVIYWDPKAEFTSKTKEVIDGFFSDVAHDSGLASNVFGLAGQYTDRTGNAAYSSTFAGPLLDSGSYPATSECTPPTEAEEGDPGPYSECLTDAGLRSQLSSFIAGEHLPTGPTQLYFLLLPHTVVTCFNETKEEEERLGKICSNNFFCAYHGDIKAGGEQAEIIYADIPFSLLDARFAKACQADNNSEIQNPNGDTGNESTTKYADVALKYVSHEWMESITDPQVNAWFDKNGSEIADKCNAYPFEPGLEGAPEFDKRAFLPTLGGSAAAGTLYDQEIDGGHFYLQSDWDNAGKACLMRPLPLGSASFTTSAVPALVGASVSFAGSASDPYGGLGFSWSFGDGATGTGASPSHAYSAPGTYTVKMTARDTLTNSLLTVEHAVLVNDVPSASFTSSPNPGTAGGPVGFNGSASSDPDGSIVSYAWSFGDGTTGSGATPTHTYGAAGGYSVTLTVTDIAGLTASATHTVTVEPAPSSNFRAMAASFNAKTGAITFTEILGDPGTFRWLVTFQNGKFGVFAASASKCKHGFVKLDGKCRPARIVFARGSILVAHPGAVTVTLKPSASALKALRNALKHNKGLPLVATFTFQSSRGGSPVSHSESITDRLKKK